MSRNKAERRMRRTLGASFLTRGGDDFDHKGLNRARRSMDRVVCEEASEEEVVAEDAAKLPGGTLFRIVLWTEIRENYGAHNWDGEGECPQYWKCKGGSEYHRVIGSAATVHEMGANELSSIAQHMGEIVEQDNEGFQEIPCGWELFPSTEDTPEEEMIKWDAERWPEDKRDEWLAVKLDALILKRTSKFSER